VFDTSSIVVFITHCYCMLLLHPFYCTFIIYSAIRLSSRKCAIHSVFSVQVHSLDVVNGRLDRLSITLSINTKLHNFKLITSATTQLTSNELALSRTLQPPRRNSERLWRLHFRLLQHNTTQWSKQVQVW